VHSETERRYLEEALRVLETWWAIGDVKFLRAHAFIRKPAFEQTTLKDYIERFSLAMANIDAAADFESRHGKSSALNIHHPYIKAALCGEAGPYSQEELANAQMADEARKRFIKPRDEVSRIRCHSSRG
jgi:hypothetical protein